MEACRPVNPPSPARETPPPPSSSSLAARTASSQTNRFFSKWKTRTPHAHPGLLGELALKTSAPSSNIHSFIHAASQSCGCNQPQLRGSCVSVAEEELCSTSELSRQVHVSISLTGRKMSCSRTPGPACVCVCGCANATRPSPRGGCNLPTPPGRRLFPP